MEVPRKIGICILMIVPSFVGAGAAWDLFHGSWIPVFGWIILMALCTGAIISGKVSKVGASGAE